MGGVGVEDVVAPQVEGERTEAAKTDVALHAYIGIALGLDNAEVVILACRHPEQVGIEAKLGRQLYGVGPYCIEPGTVKRSDSAFGGGRLVVLEHCYEGP